MNTANHYHSYCRGGGPEKDRESDPYKCARGSKVFCCEAGDWKTAIDGCYWTEWYEHAPMLMPFSY